jgi:hypothetical protein
MPLIQAASCSENTSPGGRRVLFVLTPPCPHTILFRIQIKVLNSEFLPFIYASGRLLHGDTPVGADFADEAIAVEHLY